MRKILYLFTFTLFVTSCSSQKKQINFEKIVFHSSACFGSCPIYKLQINKDKTVLLYKEETNNPVIIDDNGKEIIGIKGFFKGIVSDEKFEQLLIELNKTNFTNFEGQNCCDASMKTIIAYFNGERKYVKTMFPPKKAEKLISLLYEICESESLTKTEEKFEIEKD